MKPILSALLFCAIIATPLAAQDYYGLRGNGAYDGYNVYDRLVPPLPVPGYPVATTQSVVTTRRIIGSPLGYGGYGYPETVVTTRRVVAPGPVLEGNDIEGSILTSPYRRVVRDPTVVAPGRDPARERDLAPDVRGAERPRTVRPHHEVA